MKMYTKITLSIGADNATGSISKEYEEKVTNILSKYWPGGFTLVRGKGCWEGKLEDSLIAIIYVLNLIFEDLEDCVKKLKITLEQEKIAIEIEAKVNFHLQ